MNITRTTFTWMFSIEVWEKSDLVRWAQGVTDPKDTCQKRLLILPVLFILRLQLMQLYKLFFNLPLWEIFINLYLMKLKQILKKPLSHLSFRFGVFPLNAGQELLVKALPFVRCHLLDKLLDLVLTYDKLFWQFCCHNFLALGLGQAFDLRLAFGVNKNICNRLAYQIELWLDTDLKNVRTADDVQILVPLNLSKTLWNLKGCWLLCCKVFEIVCQCFYEGLSIFVVNDHMIFRIHRFECTLLLCWYFDSLFLEPLRFPVCASLLLVVDWVL